MFADLCYQNFIHNKYKKHSNSHRWIMGANER